MAVVKANYCKKGQGIPKVAAPSVFVTPDALGGLQHYIFPLSQLPYSEFLRPRLRQFSAVIQWCFSSVLVVDEW